MHRQSFFKDTSEHIVKLASLMVARKEQNQKPYTLLLGAGASKSSGAPTWEELCSKIAIDFGIAFPANEDPVHYLTHQVLAKSATSLERYVAIAKYLSDLIPSRGFRHLAQLIASGYIDTVFTTNWDPLVEIALSFLLPVDKIKVLVRGEVSDDVIAAYLKSAEPRVKLVKMHGDLLSRTLFLRDDETDSLSSNLRDAIVSLFRNDLIIVGSQLRDFGILSVVLPGIAETSVYYVNPSRPPKSSTADTLVRRRGTTFISGDQGQHDSFFTRLNLTVQKLRCDAASAEKLAVEKEILLKEERGRGYINYSAISEMVERFAKQILQQGPDLILFIDDPTAPGGMELKKRIEPFFKKVAVGTIEIRGDGNNRVFKRQVRTKRPNSKNLKSTGPTIIFILDVITFSGNTLQMAREWVEKWYPHAVLKTGALVISQNLKDRLTAKHPLHNIAHMLVTDRYEIFFPWGVTQTTGDFDRYFKGIGESKSVHISKRPWGTIEILAEEQLCSVRLLTLEADQKLSFQRHVCRDELFVALDDNIGLDICASDLVEPFDHYSPDIKSLILEKSDYILIPRGIWHRSKASKERVRLLEVGFGLYDQSADIERLEDTFGRTSKDGSA
jgi:hypoxanthine phosphoribosyltransferase